MRKESLSHLLLQSSISKQENIRLFNFRFAHQPTSTNL